MLVAFEGIDGAGKTTQSKRLFAKLMELGMRAVWSKEPSDGEIGRLIRGALRGEVELDQRTLALLFAADRIENMRRLAEDGIIIIVDRCVLSSLAYQGVFVPFEWILEINRWAKLPDVIFYLDLSPEVAVKRAPEGSVYHTVSFLRQVRENYIKLIGEEPWKSRTYMIDASREEGVVFDEILNIFLGRLREENEVRGSGQCER
ncbi:MAG: dTMP kinase [Candidatus Korarchaeota archaeon NZ13-K]|nr:MAG: dTMP kinase [Candidatus Korarchaeota archaeon NZ13-K]